MISTEQAERGMARMGILKFYPSEPASRKEIMRLLIKMVSTVEQLDWLVNTMIDHIGEWPGPAELRAVFTTRFKPLDGIEGKGYSSLPGFTPGDIEAENLIEHAKLSIDTNSRNEQGLKRITSAI